MAETEYKNNYISTDIRDIILYKVVLTINIRSKIWILEENDQFHIVIFRFFRILENQDL